MDSWIISDETRFRRIDFRWPVEPAVSRRKLDVDGISVPGQFPAKRLAVLAHVVCSCSRLAAVEVTIPEYSSNFLPES